MRRVAAAALSLAASAASAQQPLAPATEVGLQQLYSSCRPEPGTEVDEQTIYETLGVLRRTNEGDAPSRLAIVHPATGEEVAWEAPLPADFAGLIAALEADRAAEDGEHD